MSYHDDTSELTRSMLKLFMKSPCEYKETYITRLMTQKQNQEMAIGKVCHAVLLEDKPLNIAFDVYPEHCYKSNGDLNGVRARKYRADRPEAVAFGKFDELMEIEQCLENISKHLLGQLILSADEREFIFRNEYEGRMVKCQTDFYGDGIIYDLKFMKDVSQRAIERSFKTFQYWLQDAHYSYCAQATGFRFWVVETQYPFRIKSVTYDDRSREIALEKWKKAMDAFIEAEKTGNFEDNNSITLTLTPWDVGADEEGELVTLEMDDE